MHYHFYKICTECFFCMILGMQENPFGKSNNFKFYKLEMFSTFSIKLIP